MRNTYLLIIPFNITFFLIIYFKKIKLLIYKMYIYLRIYYFFFHGYYLKLIFEKIKNVKKSRNP